MRATYSVSIAPAIGGWVATAIFAPGLMAARRPITGIVGATKTCAVANLLAMPALHQALVQIATR